MKEDVLCTILQKKNTWDKDRIKTFVNEELKHLNADFSDNETICSHKKMITRKKFTFTKDTCQARIWNEGFGGQCSFHKNEGNLCKRHHNMFEKYGYLWLGYIHEDKPKEPIHYDGKKHVWENLDK